MLQYVEKHLVPIFSKCNNITSAIQMVTDTAKEATEEAYRAIENITVQEENEEVLRKGSESCWRTYAAALKDSVPLMHSSNLTRANTRRCQVLINKDPVQNTTT